jgi:hypothetical protein
VRHAAHKEKECSKVPQDFDDFAREHASDKENRTRLTKETKAEWEILKGLVSQFALDAKGIGNRRFEWVKTLTGRPMLVLSNVAAVLMDDGDEGGAPQKTRVRFSRKPAGSGQAYVDDSPVGEKTWDLEPEIVKDEFVWFVFERAPGRYTAVTLAEEIAKKLAQYHIEYEKAFGREA